MNAAMRMQGEVIHGQANVSFPNRETGDLPVSFNLIRTQLSRP